MLCNQDTPRSRSGRILDIKKNKPQKNKLNCINKANKCRYPKNWKGQWMPNVSKTLSHWKPKVDKQSATKPKVPILHANDTCGQIFSSRACSHDNIENCFFGCTCHDVTAALPCRISLAAAAWSPKLKHGHTRKRNTIAEDHEPHLNNIDFFHLAMRQATIHQSALWVF